MKHKCNSCGDPFNISFLEHLTLGVRTYPGQGIVCEQCWHDLNELENITWELERLNGREKRTKCQICTKKWSFKIVNDKYICVECWNFFVNMYGKMSPEEKLEDKSKKTENKQDPPTMEINNPDWWKN